VDARLLHLDVSEEELEQRRSEWRPPQTRINGGYQQIYIERVMQADHGADLDFLRGCRGHEVSRESH
jgi:dihydroxy-acid dehydratase